MLGEVAAAAKSTPAGDDWSFFYASRDAPLTRNVLEYVGAVPKREQPGSSAAAPPAERAELPRGHRLLLLDVQGQRWWDALEAVGAVAGVPTASAAAAALAGYKAGSLGKGKAVGGGDNDDDDDEE